MEDELGQGGVGGGGPDLPLSDNSHGETLAENMGSENQVDESYEEADDVGGEIMVEIVGSDVFVDGVGGDKEGNLGSSEIGDMDGHVSEKKEKSEPEIFSDDMDVLNEGVENKVGQSELGLPESRDEKNHIVTEAVDISCGGAEKKTGDSELGLLESRDENNHIVTDAVDVLSEAVENKMGESMLELPESRDEKNHVVTEAMDVSSEGVENKIGESESRDEKNHFTEAMDDLSERGESKKEETELGLPEWRDEKNHTVKEAMDVSSGKGENEKKESELELSGSTDEKNHVVTEDMDVSSEGVENKIGENESGFPELKDEKSYVITEALGVSSEGGETNKGETELALPELKEAKNHDATEKIDGNITEPLNAEAGISLVQTEEAKVATQSMISEEKTVKDDEKNHVVTEEINASCSEPVNAEVAARTEEAIVTTPMVISEEKTIIDESVYEKGDVTEKKEALPFSDDASNQSHLNSHGAINDSGDGQIVPSDVSLNPNGAGPKIVLVDSVVGEVDLVNASALGESLGTDTAKDRTFRAEDAELASTDGDGDKEAKSVDDNEGFAAESKDLMVNSDALDSNAQNANEVCVNDFHGANFESNREKSVASENEEAIDEDFDVVLDFNDEESSIDPPDFSCVGSDESLKTDGNVETNVVHQNHVVPNEPTQSADGYGTDAVSKDESIDVEIHGDTKENQPNQLFIATTVGEVIDEQKLSENVEEIVSGESKQLLECHNDAEIPDVVEQCGLPEQDASVMINENKTSDHVVDKLERIDIIPSDVVSVAAISDNTQEVSFLPEITEKSELLFDGNNVSLLDGGVTEEKNKSGEEKRESSENYQDLKDAMEVDSELGSEEFSSEADKLKLSNEERVKSASFLKMNQPGYFSPPEFEGHFAVSDLVWGKVRSHPWWPGQIFEPADASEKAVKYYKKDSYLVAYFGDRTFAWNDSSLLKPFRSHFSQIEKQSNSETFQNAVSEALEEASRRVELGLTCSCIPRDKYATIEAQIVENTGIREELSRRYRVDHSSRPCYFEPDKLVEYVKELAPHSTYGADRLDLVIARAQLSAFYRFKGYRPPIEFPSPGELLEVDEKISEEIIASHKRKHAPKDSSESKKERSLTELMAGGEYSLDVFEEESFGKKQKALDFSPDGYDKRISVYAAKVSNLSSQAPKPSFKIGECIRRVASQLTGSTSLGKDEMVIDGSPNPERRSMVLSIESFSVHEMLSQLEVIAQDPKKRHNFQNVIHTFFMGFRSSVALNKRGRKKQTTGGSAEEFEFDDVSDSYWTDRIVQNYSEEQLLSSRENGSGNHHLMPISAEKSVKPGRKPNRKRFSDPSATNDLDEQVKRRKQESSPAELILNFAERNSIPTEINLNKMFRRFGPLMESETEVDHESGCARVIFKRGSDAEVAQNSSEKFNIFGPVLVNYQIGYSPLISVKVLPLAIPPPQDDAILMQ